VSPTKSAEPSAAAAPPPAAAAAPPPESVAPPPPEKWFTLFGLVVVRRTDLLAAAAFALSISTISYQLWQFVRGANPNYHPDTVYIFFDKFANDVVATRVAGQVSFTNSGDVGHNAIIRETSVIVKVRDRTITQNWLSFAVVTRKDTELMFDIKESAHPVVVNGGSASSYFMTFSPEVKDCAASAVTNNNCDQAADFVSDTDFLKLLSPGQNIELTFAATVIDMRRKIESACKVLLTYDMIVTLAKNNWYAPRCVGSSS
jgi:hypothetical protein